jgi:hypothetical protein
MKCRSKWFSRMIIIKSRLNYFFKVWHTGGYNIRRYFCRSQWNKGSSLLVSTWPTTSHTVHFNSSFPYLFIFASQGLRFGSPFSPPLADLEYILRIRALIFHWLRLPVHVSNQKTFYTEHMLSTKCKQKWHRNALIWQRFATSRFGSNENIFPVC